MVAISKNRIYQMRVVAENYPTLAIFYHGIGAISLIHGQMIISGRF